MTTRNGKIARLSKQVRHDLNGRLQDGEPGKQLVEWLNRLPEVQEVLLKLYARRRWPMKGSPIRAVSSARQNFFYPVCFCFFDGLKRASGSQSQGAIRAWSFGLSIRTYFWLKRSVQSPIRF